MTHRMSVTGDAEALLGAMPYFEGAYVNSDTDTLIFTSHSEQEMNRFKSRLAPLVSDLITKKYEKRFMTDIINKGYTGFTREDKQHILSEAYRQNDEQNSTLTGKLTEYLDTADKLIIDGFVNFRLAEYKKQLQGRIERAVDEFVTQREYAEFTALLKYFVEIQPTREPIVHIVAFDDGRYAVYNKGRKDITTKCMSEFFAVMNESEMNYDDLLLSTLITLAPGEIVIHNECNIKNQELYNTVHEIFGNKLTICEGCSLCGEKN